MLFMFFGRMKTSRMPHNLLVSLQFFANEMGSNRKNAKRSWQWMAFIEKVSLETIKDFSCTGVIN